VSIFGSFWKKNLENTQKSSPPGRWQVGDKIANRYEICKILAGGMGIVYVCYSYEDKMTIVLKTFQEKVAKTEEMQKLFEHFFRREALIWTKLGKHPNIVRSYWVENFENKLFIVTQYIEPNQQGKNTLNHYLGSLSFPEILKFSIQFCHGMEYAYSKGIEAHRDIKPDNIMVTADKRIKITDFGFAQAFQEIQFKEDIITSKEGRSSLSIFQNHGKIICGTWQYMAPEQFSGYADKRSDIYSFGVTLYQMINKGRLPFIGRTFHEWERLHKYENISLTPSPLSIIIQRCLQKNAQERYQNFAIIREELQKLLLQETGELASQPREDEVNLDAWELINKGGALSNLGKYHEALESYNEAYILYCRKRKFWDVEDKQRKKITQNSQPREIIRWDLFWDNKGIALTNIGKYQEALMCFDESIKIYPKNSGVWYNKGAVLNQLNKHQEAVLYYDKVIELTPKDPRAWNNKGFSLENLGRYNEAIQCYDEALKIDPEYSRAQNNKNDCLLKLGR